MVVQRGNHRRGGRKPGIKHVGIDHGMAAIEILKFLAQRLKEGASMKAGIRPEIECLAFSSGA